MRKKTHKEFIEDLKEKNDAFREGKFWVLGEYVNVKIKILVENGYGKMLLLPDSLLQNSTPDRLSAINKTEYLKNELLEFNDSYRNGKFCIKGEYLGNSTKILVLDKFGEFLVTPANLLRGKAPTIQSAVNQTSYLKNQLLEVNNAYRKGEFQVIGNYVNNKTGILVEDSFGKMLMAPNSLLSNKAPNIQSAVNQTSYWISQMLKLHKGFYTYPNSIFTATRAYIKIECPIHGEFKQKANNHQQGQGCPECADEESGFRRSDWIKGDKIGKLYIIKCFNNTEEFYKLGITKNTVKQRYSGTEAMPYKYDNTFLEESPDKGYIWDKESYLKKKLKAFQYQPVIHFDGALTECFTKEGLPEILKFIEEHK